VYYEVVVNCREVKDEKKVSYRNSYHPDFTNIGSGVRRGREHSGGTGNAKAGASAKAQTNAGT
jgi:hypothetical protein